MTRRVLARRRGRLGAAIWVSFLVLATGCVAGADGPSPTDPLAVTTTTIPPTTTTSVTLEEALVDYRDCLAEHGVAMGPVTLDGRGRPRLALAMGGLDLSSREVMDALEACGPVLAAGALELDADPGLRDMVQASLEEFARCVRDHGVDYPAPVPDFDGRGSPFPVNRIPWTDPGLAGAVSACSPTLTSSAP